MSHFEVNANYLNDTLFSFISTGTIYSKENIPTQSKTIGKNYFQLVFCCACVFC